MSATIFLDWVAPPPGLRWLDIGCGNGAFTELVCSRCAPTEIHGIDPSEAQLAFARTRPGARLARFHQGNAMALPFPNSSFDAAVMALVIFFVPDPAKGVAEMARVVRRAARSRPMSWDVHGGGLPVASIQRNCRPWASTRRCQPSVNASRIDALRDLWTGAGLDAVETRRSR